MKIIILGPLLFNVMACSHSVVQTVKNKTSFCTESEDISHRHIKLAITSNGQGLSRCFQNYLKFEENKKQMIRTCSIVHINRSGVVHYAKVLPIEGVIPKDFQMCLEQEYWSMNLKGLQLENNMEVKFPMNFTSQ
jgi:hypothetical protein